MNSDNTSFNLFSIQEKSNAYEEGKDFETNKNSTDAINKALRSQSHLSKNLLSNYILGISILQNIIAKFTVKENGLANIIQTRMLGI